jgi:hypothetical protein
VVDGNSSLEVLEVEVFEKSLAYAVCKKTLQKQVAHCRTIPIFQTFQKGHSALNDCLVEGHTLIMIMVVVMMMMTMTKHADINDKDQVIGSQKIQRSPPRMD